METLFKTSKCLDPTCDISIKTGGISYTTGGTPTQFNSDIQYTYSMCTLGPEMHKFQQTCCTCMHRTEHTADISTP